MVCVNSSLWSCFVSYSCIGMVWLMAVHYIYRYGLSMTFFCFFSFFFFFHYQVSHLSNNKYQVFFFHYQLFKLLIKQFFFLVIKLCLDFLNDNYKFNLKTIKLKLVGEEKSLNLDNCCAPILVHFMLVGLILILSF